MQLRNCMEINSRMLGPRKNPHRYNMIRLKMGHNIIEHHKEWYNVQAYQNNILRLVKTNTMPEVVKTIYEKI